VIILLGQRNQRSEIDHGAFVWRLHLAQGVY